MLFNKELEKMHKMAEQDSAERIKRESQLRKPDLC